jgi:SM-20-related protein
LGNHQFMLARPGEDADIWFMSELSFLAGRFLPYRVLPGWLGETQAARLLAFGLAAETNFVPTKLNDHGPGHHNGGRLDEVVRHSSVLKDLGIFAGPLQRKALALQASLETAFDLPHTPPNDTQIEMVAHGDGAFYRPHTDTYTGDEYAPGGRRRITLVYYLHRRPRPFTGGRLRMFDLGGEQTVEIEPVHDSLLAFPSSARHEVETIACPSSGFADGRFAVNIWLCG